MRMHIGSSRRPNAIRQLLPEGSNATRMAALKIAAARADRPKVIHVPVPPAWLIRTGRQAATPDGLTAARAIALWPLPCGQTRRICQWLLLIVAALYLVQLPTPLRVNYDSIRLLGVGENLAEGRGFTDHGERPVFPPAYPLLVAALLRTGLPAPPVLAGFNIIMLAVGMLAMRRLLLSRYCLDDTTVLGILCLFLLSFVVIKHSAIPLTDIPFFALSATALVAMEGIGELPPGRRLSLRCVLALLLVVAATLVRTIGVALWPAWLWCVLSNPDVRASVARIPRKVRAAALLIVLATAALVAWKLTMVLRQYFLHFVGPQSWYQVPTGLAAFRLTELGELLVNLPKGAFPAKWQWLVRFPGFLLLAVVVAGFVSRRRNLSATDVFFAAYATILSIWPHFDSRFWLPVLPLLIAYALLGLKVTRPPVAINRLLPLAAMLYALIGLSALAYSTKLTYAGQAFPSWYLEYSASYCAEMFPCPEADAGQEPDPDAVHILKRFR